MREGRRPTKLGGRLMMGNSIAPMMASIDMSVIRQQRQSSLARLESILNVTI